MTTEGTEFWLGFMQNNDVSAPSSLEIFITSKTVADVEIFLYQDNTTRSITVTPGVTHQEVINFDISNPFAATGSTLLASKAIRITSDQNISVYAFNNRQRSADATVVLPTNSLGKEYYVSAYWENSPNDGIGTASSPSEFMIVATQDNTLVEIIPTVTTRSNQPSNQPFSVTLNQGDVFQVQADADLSGTLVKAASGQDECKTFAVFGGNMWGRVTLNQNCATANDPNFSGGYAADHLFEQMYPTSTWGKNYVAMPFQLRNNYALRVMAMQDQTTVNIGSQVFTINAGEYVTSVEDNVVSIQADKPVQVAQFSLTMSCDTQSTAGIGDPFMIMLNPNEQQLSEINFNALNATELSDYYLSVITNTDQINSLSLNGTPVNSSLFSQVPGAPEYSHASIQVQKGQDYNLRSSGGGFVAYIYAFGFLESFGYVAGAALENLNLEIEADDEFISIVDDAACLNADIQFTAAFDTPAGQQPRFNTFDWDFGNGDVAQGENVTYKYTVPGIYQVTLTASDGQGSCGSSEILNKTIEIKEVIVDEIVGASSVCPDVTGIGYEISGEAGNTYEWIVDGGTISGSDTGESILVDWGTSNANALVQVVPRNSLGCLGDTLKLPVIINKRLEPIAPFTNSPLTDNGIAEVCFDERNRTRYYVNPTNGSQYSWHVQGGTFTADSNPNSAEVFVDWGNSSTGTVWYTESNDLIDDCEGESDPLEVTIYSQIVTSSNIDNVLCNGESSGQISLTISGGKPNYVVEWDNGMTGTTISNLTAGDYQATISDELGCQLVQTFTVAEPEPLLIQNISTLPVRCFQESNGVAELEVTGGVLFGNNEYQYTWQSSGTETESESRINSSLRAGQYTVVVTDANGCEATSTFTIDEPPLLEVDLNTLVNNPICPDASNGVAFVDAKGGTPDYQFFWSNNTSTDDQNARNLSEGAYSVRIVDANGCELVYEIDVTERYPKIFIPNAFSPNNDAENDEFKPVAECESIYYMQLFNRWGTVVFSTEDITEGWDGTYENEEAPAGIYSYLIFYAGSVNGVEFEETYRGSFKLIR